MARETIMVIVFVALVGYLMMWIMVPTNIYKLNWVPCLKLKLNNTTYFGNLGYSLLIYTFPVLFVAVLGCVYLHLGKKQLNHNDLTSKQQHKIVAAARRPMIVKGPLGIVSGIELTFLTLFLALLVWSISIYLHNGFATVTHQSAANQGEKVWESKLKLVALRLGMLGNICLSFLFFPVARGSSILPLFGLTSEASITYHKWLGHLVLLFFSAHGLFYIIYWAFTNQISQMAIWANTDVANVAGELSLLPGLVMWATTFPRIRRKMFELFFYAHYLYILFVIFFFFHVGISYACFMLPGFYLFLVDRQIRSLQSRQKVRLVSARVLPCETVELNFSKSPGLIYSPTSIMFVNVPCISKLQWHPFTVLSNSNLESDKLSVMIKGEGSWTKKLFQILANPSPLDRLEVSVEGPYGPSSTNFLRYDTLVMISGGSGITPFISIIRELISASATKKSMTLQVNLICAFKNSSELTMLDLILPMSGTISSVTNLRLNIEAYVTREKGPTTNDNMQLQFVWFKPSVSDKPISPVLGPNSWLWLAAIISSSFMIFLISMGLMGSYYIYPIDHNTNEIFPYAKKTALGIVVMSISVLVTASAAVYWNKRRYARESKQIQNMEISTPAASPSLGTYNPERELESLPHQSLLQATKVQYGERPDLKKILFECKGQSVGVLVCGPKKMRKEVALISSSGLAHNLHYEFISFAW